MKLSYKAVSAEQQAYFLVEIRDGNRWVSYLKVRQVPPELAYLLKSGLGAQDSAELANIRQARLLAEEMNLRARLA